MATKRRLVSMVLLCGIFILSSCATYHLSTQSLLEQFANAKEETKVNFIIAFPFFLPGIVNGNDLREIRCLDKNNHEKTIRVTNHTGIRITKKNKTKKTFYFDTLIIQDSTINGAQSHFLGLGIKPINLNDIETIELQK